MKRAFLAAVVLGGWMIAPIQAGAEVVDYNQFETYCAKINEVERAALTKAEVAKLVDSTLSLLQQRKDTLLLTQSLQLWKQFPYKLTVINQALQAMESAHLSQLASLRNTTAAHRAKTLEFLQAFETDRT